MELRQEGQVLGGKYRLLRPLGQGGMGSVWHAQHLVLNAPVALKFIDAEELDAEALQRFLGEARMAAALRSPHVVQILDYGVEDETPHIAMELLEGETLAQRLARVGRLAPGDTARVIQQVARALGRAHDAGVIHRDLKPENVFLVSNDDDELVKVLDFGIAKASRAILGSTAQVATRTGALLGTLYYMSPEQVDAGKALDHRTDIWSLGVLAFKCLVGQLPFAGDSVGRVVLAICSRPLPVPSTIGPVPAGFDDWFVRACAREPAERFASVRDAARGFLTVCDVAPASGARAERSSDAGAAPPLEPVAPPAVGAAPLEGVKDALLATTGDATNSEVIAPSPALGRRRPFVALFLAAAVVALLPAAGWLRRSSREAAARAPAAVVEAPAGAARAVSGAPPVAAGAEAPARVAPARSAAPVAAGGTAPDAVEAALSGAARVPPPAPPPPAEARSALPSSRPAASGAARASLSAATEREKPPAPARAPRAAQLPDAKAAPPTRSATPRPVPERRQSPEELPPTLERIPAVPTPDIDLGI